MLHFNMKTNLLILALAGLILILPAIGFSQSQNTSNYNTLKRIYSSNSNNIAVVKDENKPKSIKKKVVINGKLKKLDTKVLPELYMTSLENSDQVVTFKIFVDTVQPLVYNTAEENYTGTFDITLVEDSVSFFTKKKLKDPVSVNISVGSRADIDPQEIFIDQLNDPVKIKITDYSEKNLVPLLIKTNFKPLGYATYLRKQTMILHIESQSESVQGMGIQTIPIDISLHGYTGDDTITVGINTNRGYVNPKQIKLTKKSIGTIYLTSEYLGDANIKVFASGFITDKKIFYFVFPWIFILFSLVGGLLGALVIYLTKKGKRKFLKIIGTGILTGFIFAILYYVLGIEVFAIKLSHTYNESAVLGISFLGALFWGKIYSALSGKLFGNKS
jgi:hypothetical protein